MVSGTNPLYSLPPSFELEGALARVPFIVSFATFLDETSSRADLILPEPTSFETLDDDQPSPGVPYPLASLSRPLLARPLYETRSMPEVLIELAARIGGGVAEAFPWSSWEESLRAAWSGLHRAARGSIVETGFEAFWAAAIERGGWWDEASPPSAFPYPDGKYRFDVTALRDLGSSRPGKSSDYPYSYLVYPSVAFGDGRSAHLPFLQELADPLSGVRWGSVVEIHPATAAAHGIRQGSLVEVRSPYGSVRAPAHLTPTLRPDVVAVAAGQGHTHYGRYAQGRGANAFRLMGPSVVASIGEAALGSDRVSIKEV
jgi:anaerobic selenocysteine-containing dehydrogenase